MKKLALVLAMFAVVMVSPALACGEHGAKGVQAAGCPMMMKSVQRTASNLDNGVVITMTAKEAEQVKALQEAVAGESKGDTGCKCPMHAKGVKWEVENTNDGVKLTLTSDDKEQVKDLQTYAAKSCKGGCPHSKGEKA
jgi:TusA-related sulfurtransferase